MTTIIPSITPLPPSPQRTDPATFAARADESLTAQETVFTPELNAFATAVNTVGTEMEALALEASNQVTLASNQVTLASNQVTLATDQVTLATDQANIATNSATLAAAAANATAWVTGTTYAKYAVVISPVNFYTYRRLIAGAGTIDPSLDVTNWAIAVKPDGILTVVVSSASTVLTKTPTLLQITPSYYGITVTLPDATTCDLGGPVHIIDNRGAYPVRVLNSVGVLKAFVFSGVVSNISLSDKSTPSGIWVIENGELTGQSAQLVTSVMGTVIKSIDIGGNRELIIGGSTPYGVVYDNSTNTFGTPVLIRNLSIVNANQNFCLSGVDQVLYVSSSSTELETVTLTVSGTTLTVNTAATATLSANTTGSNQLLPVGTSFVFSYGVIGTRQIRALSVSGTAVTIGAATTLDGTAGGLVNISGDKVVAVSTLTTSIYTKPYTVSGSTITAGTGTTTTAGNMTVNAIAPSGAYTAVVYRDATNGIYGGIITLSGTTTSISTVLLLPSTQTYADAIQVTPSKMLVMGNSFCNLFVNTTGVASAGTQLVTGVTQYCAYLDAQKVIACSAGGTTLTTNSYDCSGSSPVKTALFYDLDVAGQTAGMSSASSTLLKDSRVIFGSKFARVIEKNSGTQLRSIQIQNSSVRMVQPSIESTSYTFANGIVDSERWGYNNSTLVITKLECVV